MLCKLISKKDPTHKTLYNCMPVKCCPLLLSLLLKSLHQKLPFPPKKSGKNTSGEHRRLRQFSVLKLEGCEYRPNHTQYAQTVDLSDTFTNKHHNNRHLIRLRLKRIIARFQVANVEGKKCFIPVCTHFCSIHFDPCAYWPRGVVQSEKRKKRV